MCLQLVSIELYTFGVLALHKLRNYAKFLLMTKSQAWVGATGANI